MTTRHPRSNVLSVVILTTVGTALMVLFSFAAVGYLLSPVWLDHVEPNIACVSLLFNQGREIYHGVDGAARYSLLYGPNTYIVEGLSMRWLGASTFAAKLPGVVFSFLSMGLVIACVRKVIGWRSVPAAMLYYLCAGLLFHSHTAFSARSDPQLLFWASLGLWSVFLSPRLLAEILLGLAIGAATDAKAHAVIYFLPLLALLYQRRGLWAVGAAISVAVTAIALPFVLFPNVSVGRYSVWLEEATTHRLLWRLASSVAGHGMMVALPLAVGAVYCRLASPAAFRGAIRQNWLFVGASAISGLLLLPMASKEGAGYHHLMPFAPLASLLVAEMYAMAHSRVQAAGPAESHALKWLTVAMIAIIVAGSFRAAWGGYSIIQATRSHAWEAGVVQDLRGLLTRYKGSTMAMGCGDNWRGYRTTFYRTELAYASQPCLIDVVALMDMDAGHLPIPQATRNAIRDGAAKVWLIPKGENPFVMSSFYDRDGCYAELFDDDFRVMFKKCYELKEHSEYFDVWVLRDPRDEL